MKRILQAVLVLFLALAGVVVVRALLLKPVDEEVLAAVDVAVFTRYHIGGFAAVHGHAQALGHVFQQLCAAGFYRFAQCNLRLCDRSRSLHPD